VLVAERFFLRRVQTQYVKLRRIIYSAAFVGASLSYIFNVLAFTGSFDVRRWFVFVVVFLGFTYAFERLMRWADRTEGER
jgi:hypothetical protein